MAELWVRMRLYIIWSFKSSLLLVACDLGQMLYVREIWGRRLSHDALLSWFSSNSQFKVSTGSCKVKVKTKFKL